MQDNKSESYKTDMRNKEEILSEVSKGNLDVNILQLEILLDLRDLLLLNSKNLKITENSTELEIYYYIKANNLDIDYKPYRDKKADIINKLKGLKML